MAFALRHRLFRRSTTCPICQKLFRQVTTIAECCHRFCYKCITKKITEEGLHNCPVCDIDLGSTPLQKLSVDYHWQRILDEFHERERDDSSDDSDDDDNDDEFAKAERARASQFAKERAKSAQFARQAMRNQNQRPITLALPSQRMRGAWRPRPMKEVVNTTSTQSRELRARRRQGGNTSFRGSRNLSKTSDDDDDDDDDGDSCNAEQCEKEEAVWFSLVASDNQKCRAPLKQIPARYLRVKDGKITISSIKKYLMHKLNLRSETEVEISLQGQIMLADLDIRQVLDLWLKTSAPLEKKKALVGSSAGEFVLILTYARKPIASK